MRTIISFFIVISFFLHFPCTTFGKIDDISIPEEYGKITNTYVGSSEYIIFHISDIHDNYEAQYNVARILNFLNDYYDVNTITIEGADGVINAQPLQSYYNQSVREKVCSYYMKKGYLGGTLYNAIVSSNNFTLLGLENKALYQENLTVYQETFAERQTVLEQIALIHEILDRFKEKMFQPELVRLEKSYNDYHDNTLSLMDYSKMLVRDSMKFDIKISSYPNMLLLKEVMRIEETIDFSQIEREEEELVRLLKTAIDKNLNDLSLLNATIKKFKSKEILENDYYGVLYNLTDKYKVEAKNLSHVWGAIKSIHIAQKIDTMRLYAESRALYVKLQNRVLGTSPSDELKELINLSQTLDMLTRIVSLVATADEAERYFEKHQEFSTPRFIYFIRKYALSYDVSYRINSKIVSVDKIHSLIKRFYTLSRKRGTVLAERLLDKLKQGLFKHVVFITGNFHTPDVERILQQNDISYITINPHVERLHQDIPLNDVLLMKKNPVNTYLARLGLHLKPWVALSPLDDDETPLYFQRRLGIEFIAQDIYERISPFKAGLSDKIVTREIYELEKTLKSHDNDSFIFSSPRSIMKLNILDKYFIDVHIKEKDRLLRLLIESLDGREKSYAGHAIATIEPLKNEQLERGLYSFSEHILSALKQEYEAQLFTFDDQYIEEIKREIKTEEDDVRRKKELDMPMLFPLGDEKLRKGKKYAEEERQEIRKRLDAIYYIGESCQETETVAGLNDHKNNFLILKKQLSFYPLTMDDKKYVRTIERQLDERIDRVLKQLKEVDRLKQKEREKTRKNRELDHHLQEAQSHKKIRKQMDVIMEKVGIIKKRVDRTNSLVQLTDIEAEFNQLVEKISFKDLNVDDKIILKAFKNSWDMKNDLLKNKFYEKYQKTFTDQSEDEKFFIGNFLKQVYTYKELVEYTSLAIDAEFILDEFKQLKKKVPFSVLNDDEKNFYYRVQQYIEQTIKDLKSGKKTEGISLLKSFVVPEHMSDIGEEGAPSLNAYFGKIYRIRSTALLATTIDVFKKLNEEFKIVDQKMREFELENNQKALLADTEQIIQEGLRRAIINVERQIEEDRKKKERENRRQREALVLELIGEKQEDSEQKRKIALIENNKFERNFIFERLQKEGHIVEDLKDYENSYTYFSNKQFDLILLDDDIIGHTTGIDFVTKLKSKEGQNGFSLPPIIIHTNNSISWIRNLLKRRGILGDKNVHVIKKRDLEENIAFINNIVQEY